MKKELIIFILLIFSTVSCFNKTNCDMEKKAKKHFEEALRLEWDAKNMVQKENLYKKAIELCPSYAEAYNNLGDLYERQGRYKEAIENYEKATKIKNDFSLAYFGIGDIYLKTGRYEEARKWYKEGLKYDPNDTLTKNNLKIINDIEERGIIGKETFKSIFASTTRGVGEEVSISLGEKLIPFDFNKYEIREDARVQLNEIGEAFSELLPKTIAVEDITYKIEIAGHTDCRGTDEYNLDLSMKRAEAVVNYLVRNYQIDRNYFEVKGYGERVPIYITNDCVKDSREEEGHSLNRRVEIVKRTEEKTRMGGITRSLKKSSSFRGGNEQKIEINSAVFYKKEGENTIKILKEDDELRSVKDMYFIYFKPYQDCYFYIIQKDSRGKVDLLFPKNGSEAKIIRGQDYWVPSFGRALTLDSTEGEEIIYFLATTYELKTDIKRIELKDLIKQNIESAKTRGIKITAREQVETISQESLKQNAEDLSDKLEGEGAFVRVLKFKHK